MAGQWGIFILLAKWGSARMVGQVALGLAISAPVFFLTNLGLRQILATDQRSSYALNSYVRIRVSSALIGLLLSVSLGAILAAEREAIYVIVWIAIAKTFEAFSDLCYGFFQRGERLDRVGQSNSLRGLIALVAVAAGLSQGAGAVAASLGWALGWGVVFLLFDLPLTKLYLRREGRPVRTTPDSYSQSAWRLVRQALPLGLAGMIVMLNLNMPRYWLSFSHGDAALGLFAAAAYLPLAGRRFLEALGQAATPRLARHWSAGEWTPFRLLLRRMVVIGATAMLLGLLVVFLWGDEILSILYTAEYAESSPAFRWLMLSWGLRYPSALMACGIVASRHFHLVPLVFLPSLVVAIICGAVLIPIHGVIGAAWADMISALVQLFLTAGLLIRVWVRRPANV